ncbi:MAG: 5'/3'-nucleotidase SurE [Thermoguttaceae bacterium]|nr:5'/3'-nucleotidase SurE [Thermoguttaceae bacterium]MDW8077852.1 5'/3'-nucleotidase SurE [Thermoguttaceae bacterium]
MLILLTNDDGIYAPGLAAMKQALIELGEVYVVAPAREQSGVAHSITYLTPLIVKEVYAGKELWGWAVEGSPADCVKIAVSEICPRRPDLVVSGINSGLNAGINVLYSGTVAAAIEGAFFGIPSVAVSLQYDEHADFARAAQIAKLIIRQLLTMDIGGSRLFNVNIPTAALTGRPSVRVVPMDVSQYREQYERRVDPYGRPYYWLVGTPPIPPQDGQTDLSALAQGHVTITPLHYNMTERETLLRLSQMAFTLGEMADGVNHEGDRQELPPGSAPVAPNSFRLTRQAR